MCLRHKGKAPFKRTRMKRTRMKRTRIKICGIGNVDDALAAVEAGADAIGLVFYPPSPRAVSEEVAEAIVRALPPFVTTVGLFVNEEQAKVRQISERLALDCLQFHGDESSDYCASFGRAHMKAIRVRQAEDIPAALEQYSGASGLLLDAYKAGVPGGTGERFDWRWVPVQSRGLVLAGGLNADNVQAAISTARPYAVDVSSGVEESPGKKSVAAMRAFTAAVQAADEME